MLVAAATARQQVLGRPRRHLQHYKEAALKAARASLIEAVLWTQSIRYDIGSIYSRGRRTEQDRVSAGMCMRQSCVCSYV
jgi:hypothetical protein